MVEKPNQIFVFGGFLQSVSTAFAIISSIQLPVGRDILLEFLKYNSSVASYEEWQVLYNFQPVHIERLRTDVSTYRIGLPWYRIKSPGILSVAITPGAAGRNYGFTLMGKYLAF